MIRRALLFACLAGALAALALGCARGPMTGSEFLGFCHSAGGRSDSCDSVGICETYLRGVSSHDPDLATCLQGCTEVKRKLESGHTMSCSRSIGGGYAWCQRSCRTLYSE